MLCWINAMLANRLKEYSQSPDVGDTYDLIGIPSILDCSQIAPAAEEINNIKKYLKLIIVHVKWYQQVSKNKDNLNVFVHEVTDFYSHLMFNVMCDFKYKKKIKLLWKNFSSFFFCSW